MVRRCRGGLRREEGDGARADAADAMARGGRRVWVCVCAAVVAPLFTVVRKIWPTWWCARLCGCWSGARGPAPPLPPGHRGACRSVAAGRGRCVPRLVRRASSPLRTSADGTAWPDIGSAIRRSPTRATSHGHRHHHPHRRHQHRHHATGWTCATRLRRWCVQGRACGRTTHTTHTHTLVHDVRRRCVRTMLRPPACGHLVRLRQLWCRAAAAALPATVACRPAAGPVPSAGHRAAAGTAAGSGRRRARQPVRSPGRPSAVDNPAFLQALSGVFDQHPLERLRPLPPPPPPSSDAYFGTEDAVRELEPGRALGRTARPRCCCCCC